MKKNPGKTGKRELRVAICVLAFVLCLAIMPVMASKDVQVHAAGKPKGNWINYAAKSFESGRGTIEKPYIIKIADGSHATEKGFTRFKYYRLAGDIDLSAHYWTPIGRAKGNLYRTLLRGKAFRGDFDGAGHTIKGLQIKGNEEYAGLFGVCGGIDSTNRHHFKEQFGECYGFDKDAVTEDFIPGDGVWIYHKDGMSLAGTEIKNIKMSNVNINTKGYSGAVVGYAAYMDINNCRVNGTVAGKKSAGGVAATGFSIETNRMNVSGRIRSNGSAGGIIGSLIDSGRCLNNNVNVNVTGNKNVGGLIGLYNEELTLGGRFGPSKNVVKVNVSGITNVGGIIGYHMDQHSLNEQYKALPTSLNGFKATGTVRGKKNVGGLIGHEVGQNIKNSQFTGTVIGKENAGGLIGYKKSGNANTGSISQSFAKATVSGTKNVGGLIGRIENRYDVKIAGSWYAGTLRGTENIGGLLGTAILENSYLSVTKSYAAGSVKGKVNTGGLVGAMDETLLRYVSLQDGYVSAALTGNADTKGTLFGKRLIDYQTKVKNFYFDKSRARAAQTGISVYPGSPGNYGKPLAVSTGQLQRKKLAGLGGHSWTRKKPKGKAGWLPQLRSFAASKDSRIKEASRSGVKTSAWYKVTYTGNGGRTASGKTSAFQYVRYNRLKKTAPPAFRRAGFVATGIGARSPGKLPKFLKNDRTKVKVLWKAASACTPADVYFMATRKSDWIAEVNWNITENAGGYFIYRSESKDGVFEKVANIKNPKTDRWTFEDLSWGKRYYFKMTAWRKVGSGLFESRGSEVREIKILPPRKQEKVGARNMGDGRVALSLSLELVHGYEIRQAPSSGGPWSMIYDIPKSWFDNHMPSYVINRADIGRPCDYMVVGYRFINGVDGAKIYSEDSNVVSATAKPPMGMLAKIENVTGDTGPEVKLSIRNLFCTGYDVYRAQGSPDGFVKVRTIELNGMDDSRQVSEGGPDDNDFAVWTDGAVVSGEKYFYRVIPFAYDYGVKVEGMASLVREITVP